jgi:limonene 1,2-monooxygenase
VTLRFGTLILPVHATGQNPTSSIERDLDLIVHLDRLGYQEAWVGEHHSGGTEIIASPETFLAIAAERTRHIRLGTGVLSLPYHHPFVLADRMVMLDHLTRGRMMFGFGPGSLISDAAMMGIPPGSQRERMEEALDAITALLRGDGPVSMETDWFRLCEAWPQLRPYTSPRMELAVAAGFSPAGPRTAGRFGTGMLSLSATTMSAPVLADHWTIWNDMARKHGQTVDRSSWRVVGPMHVAATREQAMADVEYGLRAWVRYFRDVPDVRFLPDDVPEEQWARAMVESGIAVIGTPDDAVARIERLQRESGGFGAFLFQANDWTEPEAQFRSFELIARYVFPRLTGSAEGTKASRAWAEAHAADLHPQQRDAMAAAMQRYEDETGYRVSVADRFKR